MATAQLPGTALGQLAAMFNVTEAQVMTRARYYYSSSTIDRPDNLLPREVGAGTPGHVWGGGSKLSAPIRFEAVPTHYVLHLNSDIVFHGDYDTTDNTKVVDTLFTRSNYLWYPLLNRHLLEGTGAPAGYSSIDGCASGFLMLRKLYRTSALPSGWDVIGDAGRNRICIPAFGTVVGGVNYPGLLESVDGTAAPVDSDVQHLRMSWVMPISASVSVVHGAPRFDGAGTWAEVAQWASMLGSDLGPQVSPMSRTRFITTGHAPSNSDPFTLYNTSCQVDVYGFTLPLIPTATRSIPPDAIMTPDQASATYGSYLVCMTSTAQQVQSLNPWQVTYTAGVVLADMDMLFYDNQINRSFNAFATLVGGTWTSTGGPNPGFTLVPGDVPPTGNPVPTEILLDHGPMTFQASGGNVQPLKIDGRGLNTESAWRIGCDQGDGVLAIWGGQPGGVQGVPYPVLNAADLSDVQNLTLQIFIAPNTSAQGFIPGYTTSTTGTYAIAHQRYFVIPGTTLTGSAQPNPTGS